MDDLHLQDINGTMDAEIQDLNDEDGLYAHKIGVLKQYTFEEFCHRHGSENIKCGPKEIKRCK